MSVEWVTLYRNCLPEFKYCLKSNLLINIKLYWSMNSLEKSLTNEINNYLTWKGWGEGGGGRGPMDPPANLSVIT